MRAVVAIGLDPAPPRRSRASAPRSRHDRLDLLRGVEMQASAELGRARMTINELLSLQTGAVIELDRAAGDPADLFVNGRLIARGEVVVVDENYAPADHPDRLRRRSSGRSAMDTVTMIGRLLVSLAAVLGVMWLLARRMRKGGRDEGHPA